MAEVEVIARVGDTIQLTDPDTGNIYHFDVTVLMQELSNPENDQFNKERLWQQMLVDLKDIPQPQFTDIGRTLIYRPDANGKWNFVWSPIAAQETIDSFEERIQSVETKVSLSTGEVPETTAFNPVPSMGEPDGTGDTNAQARALVARDNYLKDAVDQIVTEMESGTWVPTVSFPINIDGSVTIATAKYSRNGNAVTISGIFTAKALGVGNIGFQINPPFPVTITSNLQVAGVTSALDGQVVADTVNQTIRLNMVPSDTTTVRQYSFMALYTL